MAKIYLTGTREIKNLLIRALEKTELKGKRVLDFPAGSGFSANYLLEQGAQVTAWDAFPEFFKSEKLSCSYADLAKEFPSGVEQFDICLFQEGIEHLSDQLLALKEFNRVLKNDGTLFVTTPNYSNIRSRLAYLFFESETPKIMPPNELDSLWYGADDKVYYGHIFSIGIMKLRMLASLAGFEVAKVHPSRVNNSSVIWGLFAFPFILLKSFTNYLKNSQKRKENKELYWKLFCLNMNPTVLFGGHLIVELKKKSTDVKFRESKIEAT